MTSISKSMIQLIKYIVKSNTYIDFSIKINGKDPKFKICDIVRTLKYKNIFAKVYTPNWSAEAFVISFSNRMVSSAINNKFDER